MLQRLKTLTLMQLNFSKFKTNLSNKKKAVVAILLRVLGVCIVTVAMFFIFMFLEKIIHIKVDEQLLLFVLGGLRVAMLARPVIVIPVQVAFVDADSVCCRKIVAGWKVIHLCFLISDVIEYHLVGCLFLGLNRGRGESTRASAKQNAN